MATILSAAMLFENFGLFEEGKAMRVAVNSALEKGIVTEDLADGGKAFGTKEVGDWLAQNI
jgi:3-isopropylmalate dehydrogenase